MKLFLTLLSLSILLSLNAQNKDEQSIRKILTSQTEQWNNGNLDAFMVGYWNNDSLLFVGKNGPTYGYKNTLANYKKGYPDTVAMGKLKFNILKVQSLAPDCYFVLGKFMLQRSIGNLSGHFTLLFKKIDQQWVIVVDHSS
jgi:ketosteroid isomerase-like protein